MVANSSLGTMQPGELFLTRQQHESTGCGWSGTKATVERDEMATALNDCFGQLSEYLNEKLTCSVAWSLFNFRIWAFV